MKKILSLALISTVIFSAAQATQPTTPSSNCGKIALGAGISTLGGNLNASYKVNTFFKIRGVINYAKISRKFKDDSLALSGSLRLFTPGVMLDLHPFENGLRLTAGAMYNGNKLSVHGTPSKNITVNGRTYTPAQIGEASGSLTFRPISPYVGIGYDSGHEKCGGLSFNVDAGVLFQGQVRGKITKLTGLLAAVPQVFDDVKTYATNEVNKNRFIKAYPVLSIGLSYKF
jgi:hypothetical protein